MARCQQRTGLGWGRAQEALTTKSFPDLQPRHNLGFPHGLSQMTPSPSVKSSSCTRGAQPSHLWSQVSPAHSLPCSTWALPRFCLQPGDSLKGGILEVTHSAGFNAVLPPPASPLPFPFCLHLTSHPHSGWKNPCPPPPLVLFLQVVGGHPAFEGLHPI